MFAPNFDSGKLQGIITGFIKVRLRINFVIISKFIVKVNSFKYLGLWNFGATIVYSSVLINVNIHLVIRIGGSRLVVFAAAVRAFFFHERF